MTVKDQSNGYDAIAQRFISLRSNIGVEIVRDWAENCPKSASILVIGAGSGQPNIPELIAAGLSIHAIDASPNMVAAFQRNFPDVEICCESVEVSDFFHRKFDGVLAIGLVFLLSADAQRDLIGKVSETLKSGGRFLFSAPREAGEWDDLLTERRSVSLGYEAYVSALGLAGFSTVNSLQDASGNHYYDAILPSPFQKSDKS